MSIAGNLKTMEFAELLQWLAQGAKTGTLVITNGEVEKRIVFKRGRIIYSASTDPKEYLGHFLVSHGFISELELAKAVEMQESNRMLLGKILVTIGAISEDDLQRLLRLKAEESIYETFSWQEAEFRFIDDELPSHSLIPQDLDVTSLVLEGARRLDEWQRMREAIPSLQAVPVAVGDLLADGDPGSRQILALVDDDRTVEEIAVETHSSEYRTCAVLFEQLQKGRLKMVRPRSERRPAAAGGAAAAGGERVDARVLLAAAAKYLAAKDYGTALRHVRAARSLEPDSKTVASEAQAIEAEIRAAVTAAGVRLDAIPRLEVDLDDATRLDLTPQEGFVLSRISGDYDLKSILKISPMHELDALLVIWRLLRAGHIRLE